jgi:hypothetical protein
MGAAANCTMTPNVSMARIALCSVAYFVAYVVGAYGADWHVSGYGDLTYRTKLLQCAAEAALFLLPSVGLLIWACGRCERAALERLRDLNLFVEYAGPGLPRSAPEGQPQARQSESSGSGQFSS